jgi:hypothetical protein
MRSLVVLVFVALGACRPAGHPTMLASNEARPTAGIAKVAVATDTGSRAQIDRALYGDLALVRSYEGLHDAVSRDGMAAAARAFERIRWKGMKPSRIAALLGQPTERDAAENTWSYNISHLDTTVFLKLRFTNGAVDRVVIGDTELRVVPFTN